MGKGGSSSSSSSNTTNLNEDNRLIAEGGGIALGKDAGILINQEFSDNVAAAFDRLINFGEEAGQAILDVSGKTLDISKSIVDKSLSQTKAISGQAIASSATVADRFTKGDKTIFTDIFPFAAVGVIALVGINIFANKRRK